MKLWKKEHGLDPRIEAFTVGDDHQLDLVLLEYDCAASLAHARMLCAAGILTSEELTALADGLAEIREEARLGTFVIDAGDEDGHTAIENRLTERCGDAGQKIHTGRSRNDQVLTALRLYEKDRLRTIRSALASYRNSLERLSERFGAIALPGYTHMRKAMPTTVKTWSGSFAAAADDDAILIAGVEKIIDQCPLGTAAGFGIPVLRLDRAMTARELAFSRILENPIYAQMSRGKFEGMIIGACAQVLFSLNKLASDLALFSTGEFGFVQLPEEICTGSSIMPHKRNPDVLELLRARYHVVLGEEMKVMSLASNLPSGYNRDLQLTKGPVIAALEATGECLDVMCVVLDSLVFDARACAAAMTEEMHTTERAYRLVQEGIPFREAYRRVAKASR